MSNVWQDAAEDALEDIMDSDPDFFRTIRAYRKNLNNGFYNYDIVASIVQRVGRKRKYDLVDAYCFSVIWNELQESNIHLIPVDISDTPFSDKSKDKNNKALSKLPEPFYADFEGGVGDCDGSFGWSRTLKYEIDGCIYELEPAEIVLEVGDTNASRTFGHLQQEKSLARWAYGSKKVMIFFARKGFFYRSPFSEAIEELADKIRAKYA